MDILPVLGQEFREEKRLRNSGSSEV